MGRIDKLCAYIAPSQTFADVGCDHGYCTLHALQSGKCEKAIVSDVSEKCLKKAEKLLKSYIDCGRCVSVCCDGLKKIPRDTAQVLIAGMGGEEIIKILSDGFIPERFVFQPMKNAGKLRSFLLSKGCKIIADDAFFDGKIYYVIVGERCGGSGSYSAAELAFGKDSVKNPEFKSYAAGEIRKREQYLKGCRRGESFKKISEEIALFNEVLK